MTRVEMPSAVCTGLDMPDGTRYDARDGYIDVERPDHLEEIGATELRRFGSRQHSLASKRVPSVSCSECGFEQLACFGERPCPRCGGELR